MTAIIDLYICFVFCVSINGYRDIPELTYTWEYEIQMLVQMPQVIQTVLFAEDPD